METLSTFATRERMRAVLPFVLMAVIAILVGGLLAAAFAHAPTQIVVWAVAFLVLVAGLAQAAFGAGQAWLAVRPLRTRFVAAECVLLNFSNLGVIVGSVLACVPLVAAATALFVVTLGMFLFGVRGARAGWAIYTFRALLAAIAISSIIGLALSITQAIN